jgi:pimeloyl-ACP methyl ester carboxylesterase
MTTPGAEPRPARLVLFPGMGADARMYRPLRRHLPFLVVPPWVPAAAGEGIGDYARRYVELGLVGMDDVIGGSSFGGFLALEIARLVRSRAVLLLGSARSTRAFPRLAALAPLASVLPGLAWNSTAAARALAGIGFGLHDRRHRDLFVDMAVRIPSGHLRWACAAIARWQGVDDPGCPIAQIHGACDRVIPWRHAQTQAQNVIPGAGHLVALTHPAATAGIAHRFVSALAPGGDG